MHNSGPGTAMALAPVVAALPVLAQFVGAATTRAAGSGAFNPAASFELAQKDSCALVALADLEKRLGEKTAASAPFDVANGRGCDHTIRVGLVSFVISGCTRDKVPTEAAHAPFLTKPLAEKWRMLASEGNNCGSEFGPVAEFGPDPYADSGRLLLLKSMSLALKCQAAPKKPLRWQHWPL